MIIMTVRSSKAERQIMIIDYFYMYNVDNFLP